MWKFDILNYLMIKKLFDFVNSNYNDIVYIIKVIIVLIIIYLYYIGSLSINRIITFIIVFSIIYFYSRFAAVLKRILLNYKFIKYVEDHEKPFRKLIIILLEIHRWINPFIVFLSYTDKIAYKINRYVSGTKLIRYNFIIYVLIKYLLMFGVLKFLIYQYYNFWYKLYQLTIIEILFRRMYGLILSILIFTDVFNNIISYLSYYGIWIYGLIYYIISILCVMWELF
jgi:hypothetical protein